MVGGGSFLSGVGQGLISSGLNHAAHSLQIAYKVDREVAVVQLNGTPAFEKESIEIIEKLPTIKKQIKRAGGKRSYDSNLAEGTIASGSNHTGELTAIFMRKRDFTSWRRLAVAYYHELVHAQLYYNDINKRGQDNLSFHEFIAHSRSFRYGGFGMEKVNFYKDKGAQNSIFWSLKNKYLHD